MNFLVKKKEELIRLEEEALASLYRRPDLTEGTYLFYYESRRVYFATHLGKDGEVEEIVGINDPYLKEAFKKELDAYLGKSQGEKPKAVEPKMEAPVAPCPKPRKSPSPSYLPGLLSFVWRVLVIGRVRRKSALWTIPSALAITRSMT